MSKHNVSTEHSGTGSPPRRESHTRTGVSSPFVFGHMGKMPMLRRRAGFTLIEMILSIAITAVIGLSLTGVMVLAQRALASGAAEADLAHKSDRALQMILTDINLATSMPERTATAITVVVPDRDGDGQPETIRYAWSGVAGDPLTRQVDNGPATALAENIYQFNFNYLTKTLNP